MGLNLIWRNGLTAIEMILSLLLIQVVQLSVTNKSMHRLVLVNRQEKHAKENCNMYELYNNWPS